MRFKILSVKDNNVRVKSGIVTFNVMIIDTEGKLTIKPDVFIEDANDYALLAGAVKGEYRKNKTSIESGDITSNDKTQVYSRK